ncbi:MAG: hypothetical protein ACLPQ0_04165 [Candidatus Binatus sp.]|jgi:hypothetical protein
MADPTLADNLRRLAIRQAKTLDFLGDYLRAVLSEWNDIFYLSLPTLPFVVWWYVGEPPMSVRIGVFLWILIVAGYYAWRVEHLKVVTPRFNAWISDMTVNSNGRIFVGLKIVNLGPPTSIHTWYGGYKRSAGPGMALSDRAFLEEEDITPPSNIQSKNLIRDFRLLATGETREGWIAFDTGPLSQDDQASVMRTLSLRFTDAFNNEHEISIMPEWARKLEN